MTVLEREFKSLKEEQGYRVLYAGWPDFLLVRPGEIRAVELKDIGDKVRPEQYVMHETLRMAGLRVDVLSVDEVMRQRAEAAVRTMAMFAR